LILRKIIKIVASRCHILRLKCTKFDFSWGSAHSAPPDPLAGLRGPTSKGREGRGGKGRGREGRERGGKGKGEREGKGKGERGRESVQLETAIPRTKSWLRHWINSILKMC